MIDSSFLASFFFPSHFFPPPKSERKLRLCLVLGKMLKRSKFSLRQNFRETDIIERPRVTLICNVYFLCWSPLWHQLIKTLQIFPDNSIFSHVQHCAQHCVQKPVVCFCFWSGHFRNSKSKKENNNFLIFWELLENIFDDVLNLTGALNHLNFFFFFYTLQQETHHLSFNHYYF